MTPLRKTRVNSGMTLSEVARRLAELGEAIDTGNLSRVERGIQRPSARLAEALANVFSGSINEMHVIYPERFSDGKY